MQNQTCIARVLMNFGGRNVLGFRIYFRHTHKAEVSKFKARKG